MHYLEIIKRLICGGTGSGRGEVLESLCLVVLMNWMIFIWIYLFIYLASQF